MTGRPGKIILVTFALLLLTACHRAGAPATTAEATPKPQAVPGIAWFKGSVDDAFKTAKDENKPLFFYWGAVWCPPCEEVRNTVFKSKRFITLSRRFIPVYLDGDTDRAQAIGEKFGVKGYPTMIVFNPAGEEINRIPGGIDISRYNSILELSLNRLRPTRMLLDLALHKPDELKPGDLTQLAYYSWGQDHEVLSKDASPEIFKQLADLAAIKDPVESARFYMEYLYREFKAGTPEKPVKIAGAAERLTAILNSDKQLLACWDSLAYDPELANLVESSDADKQLKTLWQDRILAMRHDPSLVTIEQLAGWLPYIEYHVADGKTTLPPGMESKLEQDISAANRAITNPFARQALVPQIAYIYSKAKQYDKAEKVLEAELDRAAAPWYFMADLGELAERRHKTDDAIAWYKKGWETAKGPATRFQWGAIYVRGLIRLEPKDHTRILDSAEALLKELQGPDEMFTGRNFRVLRAMDKKLQAWQTASTRGAVATQFTNHITLLCSKAKSGSTAKRNCDELLAGKSA